MSTFTKVFLVGCVVVAAVVVVAMVGGGLYVKSWFSEKAKTVENLAGSKDSEFGKKSEKLKKEYPFTAPADSIIREDQLTRFLAVRKQMFAVYKQHETEFKEMEKNKTNGFSGAMQGLELISDIRREQLKALEEQRMSPDEYAYIVAAVYKTWFAKGAREVLKEQGTATQAAAESLKKTIAELDTQIANPQIPEEQKKQLQATRDQMQKQLEELSKNQDLKQLDNELASVPKENIELFARHEAEIKQYSMAGLELLGL